MAEHWLDGVRIGAIGWGPGGLSVDPAAGARAPEIFAAAVAAGVRLLDTAACYIPAASAAGHNEELIRRCLTQCGSAASEVQVATKGGIARIADTGELGRDFVACGRPDQLRAQCETSLAALGLERIFLYQLHAVDPEVPLADSVGALQELRAAGKIAHVGVSNVNLDQLRQAIEVTDIASVQNRFSPGTVDGWAVVEECQRRGITHLSWAPLGGLGQPGQRLVGTPQTFFEVGRELGVSAHQVALAWQLALSPALMPIPGARRAANVRDCQRAAGLQLSADQLRRLGGPTPVGQ